ncbi:MAG: CotH kinase family protein [Myxococcota bacterium]
MKRLRTLSSHASRVQALVAILITSSFGCSAADKGPSTTPEENSAPPKLCSLSLTCAQQIVDADKRSCQFEVIDGDGTSIYKSYAGVELRGRSSIAFPKKNYSIELRSANTAAAPENPTNLLGMGQESDWVLDGMWADRAFSRNALVFDSFRDLRAQDWAPQSRLCTLSLNSQAQGIYRVVEKIKRDDDRLNIAADDGSGSSFVIKQDDDGVLEMPLGLQSKWKLVYPNQDNASSAQRAGIQSFLDKLRAALSASANSSDANTGVFAFLDFENTVDWVLLQEFSKNIDAYNLSVHFARSAGGKAVLIPWDIDLSLGQPIVRNEAGSANNDKPEGFIVHRNDFINNLVKISAFKTRLASRWRELRSGALAEAALLTKLDRYETTLDPARVAENFMIWPIDKIDYAPIYPPYSLPRVQSHAQEMANLRAFVSARLTWIDAHIDTYPN